MVKEIVKDVDVLQQKSEEFIFGEDDHIIDDLIDTANAHRGSCAGLAAVQIGYHKRVFVVWSKDKKDYIAFINPKITRRIGKTYYAVEGCLSVDGEHEVKRHKGIGLVSYASNGLLFSRSYEGYMAQVIQHEYDHLNGILI